MRSVFSSCLAGLAMLAPPVLPGQSPAVTSGVLPAAAESPAVYPDRLFVKLAEGSGAELVRGSLRSRTGVDLTAVAAIFARARAEPLVTALSWDELDRLHRHAVDVLPEGRAPGHLGLWFRLRARSAADAQQLLVSLREQALVSYVYEEPRYALAGGVMLVGDIPPTTPDFTAMQHAHEPTPVGHGVRQVQGIYGSRGRDVTLRMLETSWIFDHEDVSQLVASHVIGPVPAVDLGYAHHGLSGSSIIFADRNEYGITGVADEVSARFVSIELNGGIENAMAMAIATTQPGDIMVSIVMVLVPALGPGTWLPFEFIQSGFDATLTATANGRIVVVPAGNGNRSLDDPALLNRFDRSFRDSGAIMVASSDGGLLQRATYSNWGSRVDAHSWGEQVVAAGYGTLFWPGNDLRQAYTAGASGTSSSTPHIVGVVAAMQGAAKKQLGRTLDNAEILDLLHTYGPTTPDVIGRRPDLQAIFAALGIFDGLSVDEPDLALGGTMHVTMDGAPGTVVALFGSFDTADLDLGFNRHVHLGFATLQSLGAFVLTTTASKSVFVPNDPSLHGAQIYFQAARLQTTSVLELTNSCHVTIL
ncbi:MAG TPA: S8 family serine peptidase [Planctomycetota bacterium]|nr:S8 family serine peptidase [Planctomycetota bacterium]